MPVLEQNVLEQEPPPAKERWGRLPPPKGRLFGLNRSAVDRLTRPSKFNNYSPPVISKVVCVTGSKRGVRLVDLDDLGRFIQAQSAQSIEPWARAVKKPSPPKRRRKATPKSTP